MHRSRSLLIAVFACLLLALAVLGLGRSAWPLSTVLGLSLVLALGLAWVLPRLLLRPYEQQVRALSTLVAAWRDADFATSIRQPEEEALADLTLSLNQLGEELRRERQRLVQRELLLDTVVQNTPTALVLTDPRSRIVYANLAAREMVGHSGKLEGLALDEWLQGLPGDLAEGIRGARDSLCTLPGEAEDEVFHVSRRSFDLHGRPHYLYLVRRLTRELSRQEVATWKKVIRVISHELNNSLAPIASLAHSGKKLATRGDAVQLDRVFDTIAERARHLESFIGGYARFAKLPAPRLSQVPWSELLERVRAQSPFRVHGALPAAPACIDPAQIEQVLINLVRNSVEAGSPEEAIEVQVLDLGAQFQVQVRDRGQGMSAAVLEQALLPFYSTKRSGTGLGLALAREILEAHGGRIRLAHRDGGGLVVSLWLPKRGPGGPA